MDNNKREKLIYALIKVSTEKGYNNARISDITEYAGVGKGTFYLYFDSKDDCLMQATEHIANYVKSSFDGHDIHSIEDLREIAERIYTVSYMNRSIGRLYAYELLEKNNELNKSFTLKNTNSYKDLIRKVCPNDSEESLNIKALMAMGIIDAVTFEVFDASCNDDNINKQRFVKAFLAIVQAKI